MKKKSQVLLLFMCAILLLLSFIACKKETAENVISLDKSEIVLGLGETSSIETTLIDDSLTVVWESSDASVVSVYKGNIKAEGTGQATITASVNYKKKDYSAKCSVKVIDSYNASFATETVFVNDEIDVSLDDRGISGFDYEISVKKDGLYVDGVIADDVFKATESGTYSVTYSISGTDILDTVLTRMIIVKDPVGYGELFDFSSMSGVNVWSSNNTEFGIVTEGIPAGAPEGASALKIESDMNIRFTLKSVNVSSFVKDMRSDDYFEISYYVKANPSAGYTEGSLINAYLDLMSNPDDGFNDAIVKRYAQTKLVVNRWSTIKVFVREIENYVNDNEALYIRVHCGLINQENADKINSIYVNDFRFVAGDMVNDRDVQVDLTLPQLDFTALDYTVEVKNGNQTVRTASKAEPVVSGLPLGEYEVRYTIVSNQITDEVITRKLTIKNENEFLLSVENVLAYHDNDTLVGGVEMTSELLPEGAPEGATALKISSATSGFTTANSSNLRLKFKNVNLADVIDKEEYRDGYLSLVVYFRHLNGTGYENDWDSFFMTDSNDSITWYNVNNPAQMFASKTINEKYGLLKGMVKPGEWSEIKIPVKYIGEIIGSTSLTGYNVAPVINPMFSINNHCASGGAAFSQPWEFYVYSVCLKAPDEYAAEDRNEESLYRKEEREITYLTDEFESYSYTVKATKNGSDVSDEVIRFADDRYYFKASEEGTYVVSFTVKATFYKEFTFTHTYVVSGLPVYEKTLEDVSMYVGEEIELAFTDELVTDSSLYTIEITKGDVPVTSGLNDTVFVPAESGEYTVSYTVRVPDYMETVIERKIIVNETVAYGVFDKSDYAVGAGGDGTVTEARLVSGDELPAGAPQGITSAMKYVFSKNPCFLVKTANLVDYINVNDDDYFELTFYAQAANAVVYQGYLDLLTNNTDIGGNSFTKRYNQILYGTNVWTTLRLYGRDFKNFMDGRSQIYERFHFGSTPSAIYVAEYKFVPATIVVNENENINVALSSCGIKDFYYKYTVNTGSLSGNAANTVLSALPKGEYIVTYTDVRGTKENTFTRKIVVKSKTEFYLDDKNVNAIYYGSGTNGYGALGGIEKTDALPGEAAGSAVKITGIGTDVFADANASNIRVSFNGINLKEIVSESEWENKYLKFTVYYKSAGGASESVWDEFNIREGVNGKSVITTAVTMPSEGFIAVDRFASGVIRTNEWCEVKIPVSYLKQLDAAYDLSGKYISLLFNARGVKQIGAEYYIRSAEICD